MNTATDPSAPPVVVDGRSAGSAPADDLRLQAAGVDGVLVGEHLFVREDVDVGARASSAGEVQRTGERGATI